MGVGINGLQFVLLAKRLGANFDRTITLGRQHHYLDGPSLRSMLQRFGIPLGGGEEREILKDLYSEGLFKKLGARVADSVDASDYEGATVIHDFNTPIDASLVRSYTCMIDYGSLEHIFNTAVAFKNCTDLLDVGGHFLSMGPANNMMGHGFYQFSPELYFNYLSHNGFADINVFLMPYRTFSYLFHVTNPALIRDRVELVNAEPVVFAVVAKKVEHLATAKFPIQSDYRDTFWQGRSVNRPIRAESQTAAAVRDMRKQVASLMAWAEALSPNFVYGFEDARYYQLVDPAAWKPHQLGRMAVDTTQQIATSTTHLLRRIVRRGRTALADAVRQCNGGDVADGHPGTPSAQTAKLANDAVAGADADGRQLVDDLEYFNLRGIVVPIIPGVSSEAGSQAGQELPEEREAELLDALIQPAEVILEINAGSGFTSTYCAKNSQVKQVVCLQDNPNLFEAIKLTHKLNAVDVPVFNERIGGAGEDGMPVYFECADFWAARAGCFLGDRIEVQTKPLQTRLNEVRPTMLIMDIVGDQGALFEGLDLAGIKKIMIVLHQQTMSRRGLKRLFDVLSAKDFHYDSWHSSHGIVTLSHVDRG